LIKSGFGPRRECSLLVLSTLAESSPSLGSQSAGAVLIKVRIDPPHAEVDVVAS
jgi:hypothetical protein